MLDAVVKVLGDRARPKTRRRRWDADADRDARRPTRRRRRTPTRAPMTTRRRRQHDVVAAPAATVGTPGRHPSSGWRSWQNPTSEVVAGQPLLGEERVAGARRARTTRPIRSTRFFRWARVRARRHRGVAAPAKSIETLNAARRRQEARDNQRCDVAALSSTPRGRTAEDARLARLNRGAGRASILILNKKDLVGRAIR